MDGSTDILASTADGRRVALVRPAPERAPRTDRLFVIPHWVEELKAKVPHDWVGRRLHQEPERLRKHTHGSGRAVADHAQREVAIVIGSGSLIAAADPAGWTGHAIVTGTTAALSSLATIPSVGVVATAPADALTPLWS